MKTLTIQIDQDGRVAKKVFPLEPFQLMSPRVAAEGFLITVRELTEQASRPEPKPATPAAPPRPLTPAEAWRANQKKGGPTRKKVVDAGAPQA